MEASFKRVWRKYMNIGMNLSAVSYWGVEEPFVDRFHTAGAWVAKDASGHNVSATLALNADGDPTNLAGVSSLFVSVGVDPKSAPPTDEYVLTFDGDAGKISISNGTIVSQSAGKIVFDYTGGDKTPSVGITFSQLNAASPIGEVHIVRTDQQALFNAGEIFNPDFVSKVSHWGVVRFMDWENTNASPTVSWAGRSTLSDGSWSGPSGANSQGVPLEAMVKLANEAHVDMWYNVPTKADDSYVTNALSYIRDNLDPSLKVHIEYSNEVWNAAFAVHGYAQTQANALWGSGTTVAHGANIYYGYRSAQIADIAHQVFTGTHAGQAIDVLSGQASYSGLMPYMLQGVDKAGLGSAASLFQAYAVAPYFGGELSDHARNSADFTTILHWANSGSAGVDAAFHELEFGGALHSDYSLAVVKGWLASSAAAAQSAGLGLVTYEGGASLDTTTWSSTNQAKIQAFFGTLMNDPRMGTLYSELVSDFKEAGGSDFLAYNDVSSNSKYGYFGVLDSIYQNGSPRYDALIAAGTSTGTETGTGPTSPSEPAVPAPPAPDATPTAGNDALTATAAGGTIHALAGDDTVTGGGGTDLLYGDAGNDSLIGNAGSDQLVGGDGKDTLIGGAGDDNLQGGSGDDVLNGGDGNDRLMGDGGHDVMTGGAGADRFVIPTGCATFTTTGTSAYQTDEITDFTSGTDKLALSFHPAGLISGSAASVDAAAAWAAQALGGHAGTADVAAVTVGSDTYLFYDDHGAGGAIDAAIKLDHIAASGLHITDFA